MKNVKFPVIVFMTIALTACQSINSNFQDPRLSLNSVEIVEITFNGINLIAQVDVENPNGFSIPMPKIDWELFINDSEDNSNVPLIKGVTESTQSLRSRRKITLDLPLSVTYDGLYRTFNTLLAAKEASYNLAMDITFPLPVIENKIYKIDFSGILPLLQLPNLRSGAVEIQRMNYSEIVLACMVNVENPNLFPIPFPKMDYDYNINGISVLSISNVNGGEIAAGDAGTANFNVRIAYADIFRIIDAARNTNEIDSSLSLAAGLPISAFDEKKNYLDIPGRLPILHKPEISFQGITRRSLGRTMEFVLSWEAENKNNFAFDIESFFYNFSVNDSLWAQGRMDNVPQIRAEGRTIIPLNVSISTPSIVAELVDILNRGSSVNYICTGSMSLLSGLPGHDIPELNLNLQGNTRIR